MVIAAAERGGVYIPRFCWHPRMQPVGMCRMCLVEVKGPRGLALTPACYVPVADGQEVVTDSPKVKKAQDGVLEFLLINHPLDCPVCDRGGECPLQDQTFAFGPGESRFVEEKRHWEKPIPINPLVALDRERCIQCARCTRFADEVAGDAVHRLRRPGRRHRGQHLPRPSRSSPTSAATSSRSARWAPSPPRPTGSRPGRGTSRWSSPPAPSARSGCRIAVQSSPNRLTRHLGIDSDPVNHGWLCDKGRFGYEAIESDARLADPAGAQGADGSLVEASWARGPAGRGRRPAPDRRHVPGPARWPSSAGPAWPTRTPTPGPSWPRRVLGTDNVDCQMGDGLPAEVVLGLPRATIDEACAAPAVLLLGARPQGGAAGPLPAPAGGGRRQGRAPGRAGRRPAPASPATPPSASSTARARPPPWPGPWPGPSPAPGSRPRGRAACPAADLVKAAEVLSRRGRGRRPRPPVAGRAGLGHGRRRRRAGPGPARRALPPRPAPGQRARRPRHGPRPRPAPRPGVARRRGGLVRRRLGLGQRCPAPGGSTPPASSRPRPTTDIHALVLLGADPLADFPDRGLARRALDAVAFTVAVDTFANPSVRGADVVLPAAGFAERPGTTTNIEGRVTRLGQKVTAPGTARPDWMIAVELATRLGSDLGFDSLDAIAAEIERLAPSHAGLTPARAGRPRQPRRRWSCPSARPQAPVEPDRPIEEVEVAAAEAQGETLLPEPEPDADAPLEPVAGVRYDDDAAARRLRRPARPPLLTFVPVAATAAVAPGRRLLPAPGLRPQPLRRRRARAALPGPGPPGPGACAAGPPLRPRPPRRHHRRPGAGHARPGGRSPWRRWPTRRCLRGSAVLAFNQPGPGAADLIDARQPVTDVRVETVAPGSGHVSGLSGRPALRRRHRPGRRPHRPAQGHRRLRRSCWSR